MAILRGHEDLRVLLVHTHRFCGVRYKILEDGVAVDSDVSEIIDTRSIITCVILSKQAYTLKWQHSDDLRWQAVNTREA